MTTIPAQWLPRVAALIVALTGAEHAIAAPCAADCLVPGDYSRTLTWDGLSRTYTIHVPAGYSGASSVALVLDMHGHAGTSDGQKAASGQLAQSDRLGFIVVYPQGYLGAWNANGCCTVGNDLNTDDVGFLRAAIGEMKQRANINESKVYVTGVSNGGGMAQRMACEAADVVSAAAPTSFPLNADSCSPARPVTVVAFAGTGDLVVPYDGRPPVLPRAVLGVPLGWQGARDSLAVWKAANRCSDTLTRTQLPGGSRDETYENCQGGVKVGLVTVAYGQHCLYNGDLAHQIEQAHTNYAVDVSRYIWDHVFRP